MQKTLLLIACFMVPGSFAHAQENNEISKIGSEYSYDAVSQQQPAAQVQTGTDTVRLALIKNNQQYVLITACMFAFSLVVITFMMKTTPHHARDLVTIVGLVSVIFGTILMVLVVDTTDTLTAPMGIFGAIAGYLFGAAQKKDAANE
ncbi:MAG: hypothetical protein OEV15_08915 [Gallionella sp.]|nr:hypothetical protein [Gallionella sp.]